MAANLNDVILFYIELDCIFHYNIHSQKKNGVCIYVNYAIIIFLHDQVRSN
jgi:hypothetical protein